MNRTTLRRYLLSLPEAREDFPFGPETAVYRVNDKMFALLMHRHGLDQVNLKCDPQQAGMLRDIFSGVLPGYHMNKRHWNTVLLDGSVPPGELERQVDHSFGLVVRGLPKKQRTALEVRHGHEALYRDSGERGPG